MYLYKFITSAAQDIHTNKMSPVSIYTFVEDEGASLVFKKHNVVSTPTVILFSNQGNELQRWEGSEAENLNDIYTSINYRHGKA